MLRKRRESLRRRRTSNKRNKRSLPKSKRSLPRSKRSSRRRRRSRLLLSQRPLPPSRPRNLRNPSLRPRKTIKSPKRTKRQLSKKALSWSLTLKMGMTWTLSQRPKTKKNSLRNLQRMKNEMIISVYI